MKTKTITNRSKMGWNWCTDASHYDTIGIPYPDKPYHIGTMRQVENAIANDRTYLAERSGGTYMTTAWFVRYCGAWHRIVTDRWEWTLDFDLYNHATVEIE